MRVNMINTERKRGQREKGEQRGLRAELKSRFVSRDIRDTAIDRMFSFRSVLFALRITSAVSHKRHCAIPHVYICVCVGADRRRNYGNS